MERGLTYEHKALVDELTQGMEKAKQLHFHLCSSSYPSESQDLLVQRILSSYEKALLILKWNGSSAGQGRVAGMASGGPESSSVSVDGSPGSEDLNKSFRDHQECNTAKKRKVQPTWTQQVRVNSESGLDGPSDDGFSWRKYGQKDILGARYPRSYYRCTYRLVQNCLATKQVQRSDDDPKVFEITYKGTHKCNQLANVVPPPLSPEKQELKHNNSQNHQQSQALLNFRANLRVSTDNSDENNNNNNNMPHQFSFPSTYADNHDLFPIINHLGSFSSPATSGTNYFSPATYNNVQSFGQNCNYQHSESDIAEIISGHASTNNSPIGGMEFPSDPFDFDPSFPFSAAGFFT